MISHVRVLAWLNIIWGGLIAFCGLIVLLIFGGIAGIVGATGRDSDSVVAIPILGTIGFAIFIGLLILALPSLAGGIGLLQLKSWARILVIVLSALHLFAVPFGTALGIYGLWALLKPETEALFQRQPVPYAPRPYGTPNQ
jgi:hypothetical protein